MIITGNKNFGLAKELHLLYPQARFISRNTGYDLTKSEDQMRLLDLVLTTDTFINNSALWKFNQTILLDLIYKKCVEKNHNLHIICVGSTTDRVKNSKVWLYNAEKKALRDFCNSIGLNGVWNVGPKITYISFGTLSNNQNKHPTRRCIPINIAANYIKWIAEQPKMLCINEISIDAMQGDYWNEK